MIARRERNGDVAGLKFEEIVVLTNHKISINVWWSASVCAVKHRVVCWSRMMELHGEKEKKG